MTSLSSVLRVLVATVMGAALAIATTTVAPAPAKAASITYTYDVRPMGSVGDLEAFAAQAAETLDDDRGWSLGGSIRFERVASGGQFTLWLSAAWLVPTFRRATARTPARSAAT